MKEEKRKNRTKKIFRINVVEGYKKKRCVIFIYDAKFSKGF